MSDAKIQVHRADGGGDPIELTVAQAEWMAEMTREAVADERARLLRELEGEDAVERLATHRAENAVCYEPGRRFGELPAGVQDMWLQSSRNMLAEARSTLIRASLLAPEGEGEAKSSAENLGQDPSDPSARDPRCTCGDDDDEPCPLAAYETLTKRATTAPASSSGDGREAELRAALLQSRTRHEQCKRDRLERDKVLATTQTAIAEIDRALDQGGGDPAFLFNDPAATSYAVDPTTSEVPGERWRKKSVEIEARQLGRDYDEDCEIIRWCGGSAVGEVYGYDSAILAIDTLEGRMLAETGDWIIRGVKGEFYPCKPDIFEATYEPASGTRDASPSGRRVHLGRGRAVER